MEWKEVTDSQIAAVGYDPATETLLIRFQPAKWQEKKGLPGSTYYYSFVDSDTHAALLTASNVGAYFTEHIKADPVKYPYEKVA